MLKRVASQLADDAGAKVRLFRVVTVSSFLSEPFSVGCHISPPTQVVPKITKNMNILFKVAPDPLGKTKLDDAAEKDVEVCLCHTNVFKC